MGIAEQHAVTFAAGIACEGQKPVVAIYSTFMQRGYDQFVHDVALQNLDVTFALDRAGIVGADGATHAGNYDIAFLRCVPNMVVATPFGRKRNPLAAFRPVISIPAPPRCAIRAARGCGAQESAGLDVVELGRGVVRR